MATHLAYMKDMESKTNHRHKALEDEKKALKELTGTLEGQNEQLLAELDTRVRESEIVRQKLDRRERVNELKATFERTVNDSYKNVVRACSPEAPKIISKPSEMYYKQHYTAEN
jgi:anion-transporting  ArsA/GET3 family ATPase